MLVPISDDDSRLSGLGKMTLLLIVLNVLVFLFQSDEMAYGYGLIPREIVTGQDYYGTAEEVQAGEAIEIPQYIGPTPIYLTFVSSMFMHGSLMHLLFNMLFLFVFGDNVEHAFGTSRFLLFYLVYGIAAAAAQILQSPDSFFPMIGASGAISGVLGAYLMLFPRNKVRVLFLYVFTFSVPALAFLGVWILMQFWNSYSGDLHDNTAYAAHIGGFVAGVLSGWFMKPYVRKMQKKTVEFVTEPV